MQPDDPWSRVDYRRLIAWPERLKREGPFLARELENAPSRRVLDLGSGTGEHSRHLAAAGFDVTGIEASAAMIDKARDTPLPANLRFVNGDITDVAQLVDAPAGGAICLGNTLPHLEDDAMLRLAGGLFRALLPGAPFIAQILNYERILTRNVRHLPLNFRPDQDGSETVFLRLMTPQPDGHVIFTPTTLRYAPDHDPPVQVMTTRSVRLRAWTWPELRAVFERAGFNRFDVYGGFDSSPFRPEDSSDVLAVLRRAI
jgi:glycine/sarcosine N-methyltransferase